MLTMQSDKGRQELDGPGRLPLHFTLERIMALKAQTYESRARTASIAEAVTKQFGGDAIRVARRQAEAASGEAAECWHAVLSYLQEL
jgi:hypothetical protein